MKLSNNSHNLIPFPSVKRGKSESTAAEETFSCIGAGMRVMGDVNCAGVLRVSGTVIGNVSADSQVLVAKGGRVEGTVQAVEAVLNGEVIGPIVADRVEIQASAVIRGEITTSCFMIHEGAMLDVDVAKPVLAEEQDADVGHRVA